MQMGSLSASILVAQINIQATRKNFKRPRHLIEALVALACCLASLIGFAYVAQKGFLRSWLPRYRLARAQISITNQNEPAQTTSIICKLKSKIRLKVVAHTSQERISFRLLYSSNHKYHFSERDSLVDLSVELYELF